MGTLAIGTSEILTEGYAIGMYYCENCKKEYYKS